MIETFAVLLFAHVLADFVAQIDRMQAAKRSWGFFAHIAIVWATVAALTAQPAAAAVLLITAAHAAIDAVKTFALPNRLWSFTLDQGAHLVSLVAVAAFAPNLWAAAPLSSDVLAAAMALGAGAIIATRAGGFVVAFLLAPYSVISEKEGLAKGGVLIGLLERGIVFLLILVNAPVAIGFLIAAKSILRFQPESERDVTEYVIIGTLASFGWALAAAFATMALLSQMAPIPWMPASLQ